MASLVTYETIKNETLPDGTKVSEIKVTKWRGHTRISEKTKRIVRRNPLAKRTHPLRVYLKNDERFGQVKDVRRSKRQRTVKFVCPCCGQ